MKAFAWIFTLLISMIGFGGFGATTSDPVQNSETGLSMRMDDTPAIVVDTLELGVCKYLVETNEGYVLVNVITTNTCQYAIVKSPTEKDLTTLNNRADIHRPPNLANEYADNYIRVVDGTLFQGSNVDEIPERINIPDLSDNYKNPREGIRQ